MTKLLEQAIERLRRLPSERQEEAAELLLGILEQDQKTVSLSAQQVAEVERRLQEPAEYATHADVRAFFQTQDVRG